MVALPGAALLPLHADAVTVFLRQSVNASHTMPEGWSVAGSYKVKCCSEAERLFCRSEEKLKAARAALGTAAVHLIRINSGKGDPASVLGYESLWRPPLPGTLPGGGAGEPPSRPPVPPAVSAQSCAG